MKNIVALLFLLNSASYAQILENEFLKGKEYIKKSQLDSARNYFTEELNRAKNSIDSSSVYVFLGDINKLTLNFEEAYVNYTNALNYYKEVNDSYGEFLIYVKLVEYYRARFEYIKADTYLKKIEDLKRNKVFPSYLLLKYYHRKAAVSAEYYGTPDTTLYYSNKAITIAYKLKDYDNVFTSLREIANVYEGAKDYNKALKNYKECYKVAAENKDIHQQSSALVSIARVLIKQENYNEALLYIKKGFAISNTENLLHNKINFQGDLHIVYDKLNKPQKAYDELLNWVVLNRKYLDKIYNKQLLEVEQKYLVAEKEKEISDKELKITIAQNKIKEQQNVQYITILILLAVIIVSIVSLYYIKKIKNKNEHLDKLSEENKFLLSETNHRINNNLQLIIILIKQALKKSVNEESVQLEKVLTKINAIATLHRHLYNATDKRKINIKTYLIEIQNNFSTVLDENEIKMNFNIESFEVGIDFAMYSGLLITELLVNSIKYAFKNQTDKKVIIIMENKNKVIHFNYNDNGVGLPKNARLKLVNKLCLQLKVNGVIDNSKGFSISFDKKYE